MPSKKVNDILVILFHSAFNILRVTYLNFTYCDISRHEEMNGHGACLI